MSQTTLAAGQYGTQSIAAEETLISESGPESTTITDKGGFYTFGINFDASVHNAQVGDLSGHGITIQATNPGGTAVQILGSDNVLEGSVLTASDTAPNGNGADLVTGGGANNLHIEGNTFGGNGFALAYVNGAVDTGTLSQQVDFIKNHFTGTATAGVDLAYDAASGNISGNTFSGSGDGAIYLGHLSKAAADSLNAASAATTAPTHYVAEAGTITVANNDFSQYKGADILTFDANYTFANGGAGHTLTSTIGTDGKETDVLSGFQSGDKIALNGVSVNSIHQNGKGEVDITFDNGDVLAIQGTGIKAKDVASAIGYDQHVDNGNHYGFSHSHHYGYDMFS